MRKYPKYQGGFIWDFVDQGLRGRGENGVIIYKYGGDYNPYDASDNTFCNNGLFNPDRIPNPHADEVKYFYQNIWATPVDLSKGMIVIINDLAKDNHILRTTFNVIYHILGTTFYAFHHILGTTFYAFHHILGTTFLPVTILIPLLPVYLRPSN